MSKRGQDTEWDVSYGMEEILEFCFKEFAAACLSGTFKYLVLIIISIPPPSGGTNSNESVSQLYSMAYNSMQEATLQSTEK